MITINLSRKEAYAFSALLSFIPLLLLITGLIGVGYLQSKNFERFQSIAAESTDDRRINEPAIVYETISNSDENVIEEQLSDLSLDLPALENNSSDNGEIAIALSNETPATITPLTVKIPERLTMETTLVENVASLNDSKTLPQSKKYSVQLASFTNLENAYSFIKNISTQDHPTRVMVRQHSVTPYVVVAGLYEQFFEARNAATLYNKAKQNNTSNSGAFGVELMNLGEPNAIASR